MCIICVSRSGVRQPARSHHPHMFLNNPTARGTCLRATAGSRSTKGFMDLDDYLRAIRETTSLSATMWSTTSASAHKRA